MEPRSLDQQLVMQTQAILERTVLNLLTRILQLSPLVMFKTRLTRQLRKDKLIILTLSLIMFATNARNFMSAKVIKNRSFLPLVDATKSLMATKIGC